MPLSQDQVVSVSSKPGTPKNDQSMWRRVPVGADEFVPVKPKGARARTWVLVGVLGAGAAGGGWYAFRGASKDSAPPQHAEAPTPSPAAQPATPAPPPVAARADAAVAVAPPPPDAAVPAAADAISSVAPPPKAVHTKKKKPISKKHR